VNNVLAKRSWAQALIVSVALAVPLAVLEYKESPAGVKPGSDVRSVPDKLVVYIRNTERPLARSFSNDVASGRQEFRSGLYSRFGLSRLGGLSLAVLLPAYLLFAILRSTLLRRIGFQRKPWIKSCVQIALILGIDMFAFFVLWAVVEAWQSGSSIAMILGGALSMTLYRIILGQVLVQATILAALHQLNVTLRIPVLICATIGSFIAWCSLVVFSEWGGPFVIDIPRKQMGIGLVSIAACFVGGMVLARLRTRDTNDGGATKS
jgi:hypothetical protein